MHQVSTDASFRLVVLGHLSADEQVSHNSRPNLSQVEAPS